MEPKLTLEHIIRQHISLPRTTNSGGWYQVLCKVCNDHGKKGKRAGFKFDGDIVAYNCFNCNHTGSYDPSINKTMPNKMASVLEAFSVPEDSWKPLLFQTMMNDDVFIDRQRRVYVNYEPNEIQLPPCITPINPDGDDFDLYAIEYLEQERHINWKEYPFMIGRKQENYPGYLKWYGRLIIPFYKDGKLIFYQGRDLTDTKTRKYLSADVVRDCILYGYENIYKHERTPLYIVEGWFDAWHLDGIAVLSNKMTQQQIHWINQSHREKVVVPDRFGNGDVLANQALDLGWSISTPDIGDCKDPSDAIKEYGKMYTLKTIIDHTYSGFEGKVRIQGYCQRMRNDQR